MVGVADALESPRSQRSVDYSVSLLRLLDFGKGVKEEDARFDSGLNGMKRSDERRRRNHDLALWTRRGNLEWRMTNGNPRRTLLTAGTLWKALAGVAAEASGRHSFAKRSATVTLKGE